MPNLLYILSAAFVLVLLVELLRRRQLREKHAVLWMLVSAGVVVVAIFPNVLRWASDLLGVATPVNLLFFLAALLLLTVTLQLSWDAGQIEDETRTLSEELALLRLRLEELEQAHETLLRAPRPVELAESEGHLPAQPATEPQRDPGEGH